MNQIVLGDYELEEEIGVGTVGKVFRARRATDGEVVALKYLKGEFATDPTVQQRFVREVSIMQKLDHENIVKYDFCGLHEDILYYTMSYVDSGSLKDLLHAPTPWRNVVDLGTQVCAGIAHAHQSGVVHRDLKPANLYLSANGLVKVGDFGIALDYDSDRLTAEGFTVGTCRYMAPEQITADEISPQADLYSLGCILFEMLTGRVPFDGETPVEIVEQHLNTAPPAASDFAPDCPAELSQLVQQLMSKQPADRPASASEVRDRLLAIAADPHVEPETRREVDSGDAAADSTPNLTQRLQESASSPMITLSWPKLAMVIVAAGALAIACWAAARCRLISAKE